MKSSVSKLLVMLSVMPASLYSQCLIKTDNYRLVCADEVRYADSIASGTRLYISSKNAYVSSPRSIFNLVEGYGQYFFKVTNSANSQKIAVGRKWVTRIDSTGAGKALIYIRDINVTFTTTESYAAVVDSAIACFQRAVSSGLATLSDGDYGDVVVSGGGLVMTVDKPDLGLHNLADGDFSVVGDSTALSLTNTRQITLQTKNIDGWISRYLQTNNSLTLRTNNSTKTSRIFVDTTGANFQFVNGANNASLRIGDSVAVRFNTSGSVGQVLTVTSIDGDGRLVINPKAGGSGTANCEQTLTKTSHGFRKWTPIYWNGLAWARPTYDSIIPSYIVVDSTSANTFKVANCGNYSSTLTSGLYYYKGASPGYSLTPTSIPTPLFEVAQSRLILQPLVGFQLAGGSGDVTSSVLADTAAAIRADFPSGGGSPGGSTTQVQYNNAGSFAGSASLTLVGDTTKMDKAKIPSTGAIFAGNTKVAHFFTPSGGVVSNVFLGGSGNTTMTSVGELAGSIFSGCHNSVVGYNALKNNVYGYLNQVVGFESMMYADSAAGSCVLGGRALQYARGHDNIAIGDGSLQYTFYGDENVSVGYRSGNNNKSGRRNVNIGTTSNFYGSNLSYCTFLGYDTGVAIGDSLDGFENSTAVGQGAKISESNHMVLGNNNLLKVETTATIHANRVGSNFRMKGGGTDDTDGGFYVGSSGNITLANWSGNKGLSIFNSDGRIEQLGTGSFKVNNLGINTAASGTHKLNVSGTSAFSGTINANQTGANFRAQGTGTGAGDAAVLASGGNIWFSNWDANLGIKILSSGIVHTLGNGKFGAGGVTAPTAMIHAAASTTSAASYRIPAGSSPTTPNEGDVWNNGTDLKYYTGASTYDLARVLKGSATLDFPDTASGSSSSLTITVTGAATTDSGVSVQRDNASISGTMYEWVITGANTVTVYFHNFSGSNQNPASGTFRATVTK